MGVCVCICLTVIIVSSMFTFCHYQEQNNALSMDVEMDLRREIKACRNELDCILELMNESESERI